MRYAVQIQSYAFRRELRQTNHQACERNSELLYQLRNFDIATFALRQNCPPPSLMYSVAVHFKSLLISKRRGQIKR